MVCCNQCFESIAREDTLAARIWIDLCTYAAKFGLMELREYRVPEAIASFKRLEEMGYLVTADGEESVKLKVKGHEKVFLVEGNVETFCIKRNVHDKDWK